MKKYTLFFIPVFFFCLSVMNLTLITAENKKAQIISAVSGYTIFIDPGHGGKDNGTSYNTVVEDEINLSIANKIYERLLEDQARVLISRVADYDLSDVYAKNHKIQDLNKRIEYMKNCHADVFVSIHLNAYRDENVSGAQVFYKSNLEESKKFASIMQKNLNQLNEKEKKPKTGDYYLFKNTGKINGIIIECGFLSNSLERKKLTSEKYQKKVAECIHEGIISYFETKGRI